MLKEDIPSALPLQLSPMTGETNDIGTPNQVGELNYSIAVVQQWRPSESKDGFSVHEGPLRKILLRDSKKLSAGSTILLFEPIKLQVIFLGTKTFVDLVNDYSLPFKIF
jgi:hypothetical protein